MTIDWKLLAPHKPLDPGAESYVASPSGGAREIADWVLAGGSAVLVGGPAGIGKSTELAQAAKLLQADRVSCLVPLDRWENMRRLTADRLQLRLAGRLVDLAVRVLKLRVSMDLHSHLAQAGVLEAGSASQPGTFFNASPPSVLKQAISEVSRLASQPRIAFLIDGLEKVGDSASAGELFEALTSLPDGIDVVVVIPWNASFGLRPDAVVRPGERFLPLRALEVDGEAGEAGRIFLLEVLRRRLQGFGEDGHGNTEPSRDLEPGKPVFEEAACWSGGIPRTFLQLIADAGTYARLRQGAEWPEKNDLMDAVADQQDSFRRLLLPGDTEAIQKVVGTDGREMELTRRVRLMAHGVLLERWRDRRPMLEVHPLVRLAVEEVGRDA